MKTKRKWLAAFLVVVAVLGISVISSGQAGSARGDGIVTVQAEEATTRTVGGNDGPGWNLWSDGHIAQTVPFGDATRHRVAVRARGNSTTAQGPIMELRIDGRPAGQAEVGVSNTWSYDTYNFEVAAGPGDHEVAVAHVDDPNRPQRNVDLVIDQFTITPIDAAPASTAPSMPPLPTTAPTTAGPTTAAPPTAAPTTAATRRPTTAPASPPPTGGAPRSPHVPAGYTMRWNDEFDSLSLDLEGDGGENWGTFFNGWNVLSLAGNGDQCMKADPSYTGTGGPPLGLETHRVRNGVLTLFGRPIPGNQRGQFWNYQAACGMISGQNSHAQTYGYWETRMRIPNVSTGHHWAIWLLPENNAWPPEVDMLEVVGLDPRKFHFTGHYNDASGEKQADLAYRTAPGAADDWYTIGLEWTRDSVVWYLDGVEVHRMRNFVGTTPNYFLISPEIGGNWPGPTNGSTVWPMSMDVDYVRIYSR